MKDSGSKTPPGAPARPSDDTYESMRDRLLTLGYLERPLDRFVLAGLTRPGSFLLRHAAVSLRVSLVAGPLLGLLFALAVVVVNRPRLSRPLDAIVLSVYFSLAFGAAVLVLETGAGLALAAYVRIRGRGVAAIHATAARAGFGVSLVVSAYLAFWWRGRAEGSGGAFLDGLGLAALVLVNAALLRVSSLASLAALVRASDLLGAEPERRRHGGLGLATLAAALLTAGFFLAPGASRQEVAAPFERAPVEGRLLVIGWDGMPSGPFRSRAARGSPLRERFGERGVLVNLASSAAGSVEPSRPSFWTGVATGRPSSAHGVSGAEDERVAGLSSPLGGDLPLGQVLHAFLPGRKVAVSARARRARTLWEILGEREGTGAVGWWATWPADGPGGADWPTVIVSDRALFGVRESLTAQGLVSPAALGELLESHRHEDLLAIRAGFAGSFHGLMGSPILPRLEEAATIDAYAARVAIRLLGEAKIADLFVYLPGLDIVRSFDRQPPRGRALEAYADYCEQLITEVASHLESGDWLIVIGDAGRAGGAWGVEAGSLERDESGATARSQGTGLAWISKGRPGGRGSTGHGGSAAPREANPGPGTGPLADSASGWVLLIGPGVVPAEGNAVWDSLDIAPTILNLRGFPKSLRMPGSIHVSFLDAEWRRTLVPREIPSYGDSPRPPSGEADAASEEEALERLKSLGYVR